MTETQNPPHRRVSDADAVMLFNHAVHVRGYAPRMTSPANERTQAEAQMAETGVPIDFEKMRAELHAAYEAQRAPAQIVEARREPTTSTPAADAAPVNVLAEPGTDLALALEQYAGLKAAASEAAEAYDDCKAQIKLLMDAQPEGTEQVIVRDPSGSAPPLQLRWSTRRTVDTTRMKRDHPDFVEAYIKEAKPTLSLTEVGSKGGA